MLHYEVHGPPDAPAVLFLHAVGIDASMWNGFVPQFPGLRAVLVDLPGHGGSRDMAWVSLPDTAQQVAAVIDEVGAKGMHVAGISLGSYVGLTLLAQNPTRFRTAFLSGMHAGGMERQWAMRLMSMVMARVVTRPYFARRTAEMFGATGAQVDQFITGAGRTRPDAFRRATNDVVGWELPAGLDRITTETVFVAGSEEHDLILSSLPILANSLPHARAITVASGGHGWPGAMPQAFVEHIRALTGTGFPP